MKLIVVKKIEGKVGKKNMEYRVEVQYDGKVKNVRVDKKRFFRAVEGGKIEVTRNEIADGIDVED